MNQPQPCRPEAAARRSRRVPPQPLTAQEQHRYAPYFEPELLASVRIFDGQVPFWLRPDMCGVTLGPRIYFRPGACARHSPGGIELLAHELAHVQQFSRGMTLRSYLWASRRGYWRNPFEVEARAMGARVRAEVCRAETSVSSVSSLPLDGGGSGVRRGFRGACAEPVERHRLASRCAHCKWG